MIVSLIYFQPLAYSVHVIYKLRFITVFIYSIILSNLKLTAENGIEYETITSCKDFE